MTLSKEMALKTDHRYRCTGCKQEIHSSEVLFTPKPEGFTFESEGSGRSPLQTDEGELVACPHCTLIHPYGFDWEPSPPYKLLQFDGPAPPTTDNTPETLNPTRLWFRKGDIRTARPDSLTFDQWRGEEGAGASEYVRVDAPAVTDSNGPKPSDSIKALVEERNRAVDLIDDMLLAKGLTEQADVYQRMKDFFEVE